VCFIFSLPEKSLLNFQVDQPMTRKTKKSLIYWIILSPLLGIILLPYFIMLTTSVKPKEELFMGEVSWFGSTLQWSNFYEMWKTTNIGSAFFSSLYVSIGSMILVLLIGIPAAYACSRMQFKRVGIYRAFLLITQMISPIVLIVGLYRVLAAFKLVDNLNGLLLANCTFSLAFGIWMLQSYFETIPIALEEAAMIDGAGLFQRLTKIFLPLAVPAMVVTAVFTFITAWNEYLLSMTLMITDSKYPLTVKVTNMTMVLYRVDWHHVMTATLLATIPVAIMFSFLQKYLIRGMAVGAVK
jgi:multiple sugar transport system permease protein